MRAAVISSTSAWSPLRSYWLETKFEFLRLLRTPSFCLPALLFPLVFYLMFGVLLARGRGGEGATYLLATYLVFGIMGAALFGFGVTVAMERAQGLLRLKRALPVPAGGYLLAKTGMAMLFALIIGVELLLAATLLGGVRLEAWQWPALLMLGMVGTLPFCALGLFIGAVSSGNGAPAVANLIYLPMAFLSGLWLPLAMLPAIIGTLAPMWPAYHLAQLALKIVGHDAGYPSWLHVGVLLVVTVGFYVLAHARLKREE